MKQVILVSLVAKRPTCTLRITQLLRIPVNNTITMATHRLPTTSGAGLILRSVVTARRQHPRVFAGGAEGGSVALGGVGGQWSYFHASSSSLLLALPSY